MPCSSDARLASDSVGVLRFLEIVSLSPDITDE